jgi:hypothetical protein
VITLPSLIAADVDVPGLSPEDLAVIVALATLLEIHAGVSADLRSQPAKRSARRARLDVLK